MNKPQFCCSLEVYTLLIIMRVSDRNKIREVQIVAGIMKTLGLAKVQNMMGGCQRGLFLDRV